MTAPNRPLLWSFVIMLVFGCSQRDEGGGGCGSSSSTCDIILDATVCGDLITLECLEDAAPEAEPQCDLVLQEEDASVYCCTALTAGESEQASSEGGAANESGSGGAPNEAGSGGTAGGGGA